MSSLLEESEKSGVKLTKEVDKLNSKLQDLEVRLGQGSGVKGQGSNVLTGVCVLLRSCCRRRRARS